MKAKFIKWHKSLIKKTQKYLNINEYESLWISWVKGLIVGILLMGLLSGCSNTEQLTFTEMINVSQEAVLDEVPGSAFYVATAFPGVRAISGVYRGNDEWPSVSVKVTEHGKTIVKKQSEPWMECVVIELPLKMTLEEAEAKLADSKYAGTWSQVSVRSPLGPIEYPALYIFTVDNIGWIAVNTITGKVFQLEGISNK